ncbi:hypothetical protein NA66_1001744 [Burkholderia pyrrocinia]|uniref:Uncharacterized protein n=1 Tax=Burkholderia pyrrocinia TaxID=60550 RepID=A0A318J168_BURPY|nr:hypothetical protein NA66_1001744 [Burkholderia pyrrocinia]SFW58583.1 hypothetical protein SAMN03159384_03059 [Burkholderia sp. NFACC33-1]SFY12193.1 hypothetical protein SAMN03159408_03271 [Burkholderia sp. NFPP32]
MIHIHAPKPFEESCQCNFCPTCQRMRRMFVSYYEWYGARMICAGCGDQWDDGEMCPRPFERGWRKSMIQFAIRNLARIGVKA